MLWQKAAMARGLILSSLTLTATTTCLFASISKTPPKSFNLSFGLKLIHHHYHLLPLLCSFSVYSSPSQCSIDMSKNTETFSRRMAMAGLEPHHRIGQLLFVSLIFPAEKLNLFGKFCYLLNLVCALFVIVLCQNQT